MQLLCLHSLTTAFTKTLEGKNSIRDEWFAACKGREPAICNFDVAGLSQRVLSFRLVSVAPLADAAAAKTNGAYTEIISIGPFVVVVIVEIIVLSL